LKTNALFAGAFLIIIFLSSEFFNQTIRDNQDDIEDWLRRFGGPFVAIWSGLSLLMHSATAGNRRLMDLTWILIVLVITVVIEGFLDPGFGLNKSSVLLFFSLLVAVGLMTYLTEGGEAFYARLHGEEAAVRVFPLAIFIAALCVAFSRLGEFSPGVLYGFVGTAVFLRPTRMNDDEIGKMIFFPLLFLMGLSVTCWLLVDNVRSAEATDFNVFLEGTMVGIFIGGIEGIFLNMVPIAYMDGSKLMRWNPLVWLGTAAVATFLFWMVLLNDQRAYFDALEETTPAIALIAGGLCLGITAGTWAFFRYRPGGHA
jgi:hypothetical protein